MDPIFSRTDIDRTIPELFQRRVRPRADRMAVRSSEGTWTYEQLDRRAGAVTRDLVGLLGSTPEPIAILMNQGLESIAATLGVLMAGKFYVPLDPAHPVKWNERLIGAVGARLLISSTEFVDTGRDLAASAGARFLEMTDDEGSEGAVVSADVSPDSIAYVFYTSGSTGRPKGVFDTHRNVLHNVMRYTNNLGITGEDVLSLVQPPAYSGSISSLFCALVNGATVVPVDVRRTSPSSIARAIREERITIFHSTPAILRTVLRTIPVGEISEYLATLRVVRLEGDRLSPAELDYFVRLLPQKTLIANGLGMTEAGLVAQYFVDRGALPSSNTVPVGLALEDMDVRVVDHDGNVVPPADVGELAIRSRYLALGYWNEPELTRRRFGDGREEGQRIFFTGDLGRIHADGLIEHLGRVDGGTVRIGGMAVTLSTVEAHIEAMDDVSQAVVIASTGAGDRPVLTAHVVANQWSNLDSSDLRRRLASTLPGQMIPNSIVFLSELPLTSNGKVDRSALGPPSVARRDRTAARPPADPLHAGLTRLWQNVLGLEQVGPDEDFFELGGDSLLAVEMMDGIVAMYGKRLPPSILLTGATIRHVAKVILDEFETGETLTELRRDGSTPPFYFLHGDYIAGGVYSLSVFDHVSEAQPICLLHPLGMDGGTLPESIEEAAQQYAEIIRKHQPKGPYRLGGHCNGGLIAVETARLLLQSGHEVDRLVVIAASAANRRLSWLRSALDMGSFALTSEKRRKIFRRASILVGPPDLKLVDRLARTARKIGGFVARGWSGPALALNDMPRLSATDKQRGRLQLRHVHIEMQYLPTPYPGPITLMWPRDNAETVQTALRYWRQIVAEIDVKLLPGDHVNCRTEYAKEYGQAIDEALR